MEKLKRNSKLGIMFAISIFAIIMAGCGGSDSSTASAASANKTITAYSVPNGTVVIDESTKTIDVTVPNATAITALVATFATTGSSVKVGATTQTSGTTPNNFTVPLIYTVTAADGSTAAYTVTLNKTSDASAKITSFFFTGLSNSAGDINETAKTIAVSVPNGTVVTSLVANFITTGNNVKIGATTQVSGTTANNFTAPSTYVVTAENNTTASYTVTVTVASASAKAITSFSFDSLPNSVGVINEGAKTIQVGVLPGTNVTGLIATFTTTGSSVKVAGALQASKTTANNFTSPVIYTVAAVDASTVPYTVTVTQGTGPAPVGLGTSSNFAILTKAGITNTGTSSIIGDIGASPISYAALTGFALLGTPSTDTFLTSAQVTGKIYAADLVAPTPAYISTAISNMETAFTDAAGRTAGVGATNLNLGGGTLGGNTLVPGTYTWGSNLNVTTDITLSGGANDVWIFQVSGIVDLSANRQIILAGGALAKNIFWQVSGGVVLEVGSTFNGNIITATNIAMQTGATLNGRLLAQTASTLDTNTITKP